MYKAAMAIGIIREIKMTDLYVSSFQYRDIQNTKHMTVLQLKLQGEF